MSVTTGLFYAFSAVLLFAAFRVITARNPVHAALFLVLTFFQAAMIWMLLKAEFLSITLVLVYVGAVMVLFLFVVMADSEKESRSVGYKRNQWAAVCGQMFFQNPVLAITRKSSAGFAPMKNSGTKDWW